MRDQISELENNALTLIIITCEMHALITTENNAFWLWIGLTKTCWFDLERFDSVRLLLLCFWQTEQLKGRSPVYINMFTLVYDLWAAQFVTINVDGTVTSNDICVDVVISRPSRIQYVSQLLRFTTRLRDHMLSRRLCRVVKRPLQSLHWYNCLLELGSLVTSHVHFNLSISEVTFDLAWLWNIKGRFALVRSTPYLH